MFSENTRLLLWVLFKRTHWQLNHVTSGAILDLNMLNFYLFYMIALFLQIMDEVDSETRYSSDKSTKMHLSNRRMKCVIIVINIANVP